LSRGVTEEVHRWGTMRAAMIERSPLKRMVTADDIVDAIKMVVLRDRAEVPA
jgi:hypothetical protein